VGWEERGGEGGDEEDWVGGVVVVVLAVAVSWDGFWG